MATILGGAIYADDHMLVTISYFIVFFLVVLTFGFVPLIAHSDKLMAHIYPENW